MLIHAAGSGVGTAAVQLAHDFGLTVYVTAGSQDKIEFVKKLGASGGFNYKEGSFVVPILELTGGDVVVYKIPCSCTVLNKS